MFASVSVCVWKQWSQWKVNSSTHDTGLAWFTALTTTLNVPSLSIYYVVRHKRGTYSIWPEQHVQVLHPAHCPSET